MHINYALRRIICAVALMIAIIVFLPFSAQAQSHGANPGDNLVVCGNNNWGGINQSRIQNGLVPKLTNTAYFGPSGEYSESTLSFVQVASGAPSAADLDNNSCNIWFSGYDGGSAYTALAGFIADGGFVISGCDAAPNSAGCQGVGVTVTNYSNIGGHYVAAPGGAINPLTCENGAENLNQVLTTAGGASGYFNANDGDVLAIYNLNGGQEPPLIIVDDVNDPSFLLTGDIDMFTTENSQISSDNMIDSDQEEFIASAFKLAVDSVTGVLQANGGPSCGNISTGPPPNPELSAVKTVTMWDPNSEGIFAVPGNEVVYTLTVSNTGNQDVDTGSVELIDLMPLEVEFWNGDLEAGGPDVVPGNDPVGFMQSSGAGLTFNYNTDVRFATGATAPASFSACTSIPQDNSYRADITYICFNPKGVFAEGDPDPQFTVSFRARIK